MERNQKDSIHASSCQYDCATRCDGNRTKIRQCTEPEEQLADLYRLLKLKNPPLKQTVKICVVHSEEIKKIDT